MKNNFNPKYRYVTIDLGDGRIKTIAITHYAKKSVRGVAVCSPEDEYNAEFGEKLARLRCDMRIEEKRFYNNVKKKDQIQEELQGLTDKLNNVVNYINDTSDKLYNLMEQERKLLNES